MVEVTYQMVLSTLQTAGILVGIFYYIMTLRNAQRNQALSLKAQEHSTDTRQAQLLMQIVNQWSQPGMVDARDQFMRYELNSFEDYMNIWSDHETAKIFRQFLGWIEGIGVLVRENYLDIKIIAGLMGGNVKGHWEKMEPYVMQFREEYPNPRHFIEWEYLYNTLLKYAEENPDRRVQDTHQLKFPMVTE